MKSLTSRIEDLEHTTTADMVGDYLFQTRDNGATYTRNEQTYTRADLDQLEARGASITIINIYREAIDPLPEARLILSLPDNGRD